LGLALQPDIASASTKAGRPKARKVGKGPEFADLDIAVNVPPEEPFAAFRQD
jgi:hypothetical protein